MNIPNFIAGFQQLAPEFLASYCIVNREIMPLDEIQNMGYEEFSLRSKINMPLKLYRYYPNIEDKDNQVNYSIQALENNTVYLQTPTEFDDVYDSDIYIVYPEYERLRLLEYCRRCGLNVNTKSSTQEIGNLLTKVLHEYFVEHGNLENVFKKRPESEIEQFSNEHFALKVIKYLCKTVNMGTAIAEALKDEYRDYISMLKTNFRTTCFATTPYSQLMWGGAYANCHKGFCIEYTVLPNDETYKQIYYNLFPMIYCKTRPNMTSRLVAAKDKELTIEILWDIYFHGALRKSIDWAFQDEWRLLLPFPSKNTPDYNVKIFPITKVYLGNRMPHGKREEIIDICNKKEIPYIGVKRNPTLFEMQDCEIKCENCLEYQSAIKLKRT